MAELSKIEWTDHTFNPWEGCQKVGPGCDHCYAETRNARYVKADDPAKGTAPNWGPGAPRRRTSAANWRKPLQWNAAAAEFAAANGGRKQRVFCASLADVFDNAVDVAWRRDLFDLIARTPMLDWLLLTKRIGNVRAMVQDCGFTALPVNVWLGATVVNQAEADRDIPKLLMAPCAVRFLSMEPLLGEVDLRSISTLAFRGAEVLNALTGELSGMFGDYCPTRLQPVDWVIVGGESGDGARPMHPDWVSALRDQCAAAEVPFLFKQWGEWAPASNYGQDEVIPSGTVVHWTEPHDDNLSSWKVGKKKAGRLLDGVTHTEFPS